MYLVTAIYDRDPISLCKITPHTSAGVPMALPAGYRNMQYYWSLPAPDHSDPDDCPSVDPEHSEARSAQTSCTAKPTSVILQSDLRNMSLCSFGPVFLWHPLHRTLLCPGTFRQLSCHPLAHDGTVCRWNLSARRRTVYAKFPDEVPKSARQSWQDQRTVNRLWNFRTCQTQPAQTCCDLGRWFGPLLSAHRRK
ncbi:unknown [Clostridium sp. CAG:75]|nr:unknown [Clostridium sp. CAG:75]